MLKSNQIYLTKQGLTELKEELAELTDKKRPALVKRVAEARNQGDLAENSEYTNAREELALTDTRIEELQDILAKAQLIKENNGCSKKVALGCKVVVRVNKDTHVYRVVGEWEADPLNKKISHKSPLGKALLGKEVGEKVEIIAPVGKIIYEIKEIS
jgi:transcription elongation factor GreA